MEASTLGTKINTRAIANTILCKVILEKKSLTRAIPEVLKNHNLSPLDQSLIKSMCYGVLRYYYLLIEIANNLLHKPLNRDNQDIFILILLGIYQLAFTRVPAYAAVAETVDSVYALRKNQFRHLVNAILRNYQRRQDTFKNLIENPGEKTYPNWIIEILQKAWPQNWKDLISNSDLPPPMHLRVNVQKTSQDDYLKLLVASKIEASAYLGNTCGITLEDAVDVKKLPHFEDGWTSVQDLAAQFAPTLLELKANQTVLDACSAPGGKTAHILETEPKLKKLIALDLEKSRTYRTKENLARLGLSAEIAIGDAQKPENWWNKEAFDRILLDAPCSAFGVIRRHPDIKILRSLQDIENLAHQQLNILEALWRTLKPGGILLYATCSILPQENDQVIEAFLQNHDDAKTNDFTLPAGHKTSFGWQIFPTEKGPDGFYYSKLTKKETTA